MGGALPGALLAGKYTVSSQALECNDPLPVLVELDAAPSVEELSKAVDSLDSGKAQGNDGILPEVIKAGKKTAFLHHLHELLLQF